MSEKTINTRIKHRYDTIANWTNTKVPEKGANLILKEGEIAIADCGNGVVKLKVGNGISSFSQLRFIGEVEFNTEHLTANSIAQGIKAGARPYGIAAGAYLSALADFSLVMGYNAKSVLSDQYSFVWNGDYESPLGEYGGQYYESHGKGTFSINPVNGLSGVYVGELNLAESFSKVTYRKWVSSDVNL